MKPIQPKWQPTPHARFLTEELENSSKLISKFDRSDLANTLKAKLEHYFGRSLPDPSVSTDALLGFPDACVVAKIDDGLAHDKGKCIAGFATLLSVDDARSRVPVVVLTYAENPTTLNHEKIHLCQYLAWKQSPLTEDELYLALDHPLPDAFKLCLAKSGQPEATSFVFRMVCFKYWNELEAHYFADTIKPGWHTLLSRAVASAFPVSTLIESMNAIMVPRLIIVYWLRQLQEFCDVTLMNIDWIRECRARNSARSHYEEVYRIEKIT